MQTLDEAARGAHARRGPKKIFAAACQILVFLSIMGESNAPHDLELFVSFVGSRLLWDRDDQHTAWAMAIFADRAPIIHHEDAERP